jgi:hypothetical protein
MRDLLKVHPLKVYLLSFLDISICSHEHKYGFVSKQIVDSNLLNNHLLSNDEFFNKFFFGNLVDDMFPLLQKTYTCNPWFKLYKIFLEKQDNKNTNVCVWSAEIVKTIIINHDMNHKTNNNRMKILKLWNINKIS